MNKTQKKLLEEKIVKVEQELVQLTDMKVTAEESVKRYIRNIEQIEKDIAELREGV